MFFSVLCLLCLCARLFICALWSPAGKRLSSWLSFVVSNCEFVSFPLVFWVRCGTWMYRFLIFAPLLTLNVVYKCIYIVGDYLSISQSDNTDLIYIEPNEKMTFGNHKRS